MKKNTIYILIAVISGIILGKYIFNQYKEDAIKTISNSDNYAYLIQYGVYENEENMKEASQSLDNYFYYTDDDGYHVLIGIVKNKNIKDKILKSYDIEKEVYMKKVTINNLEFLQLLEQYDNLITQTDDSDIIKTSQKQVLSKFEELVLNNE